MTPDVTLRTRQFDESEIIGTTINTIAGNGTCGYNGDGISATSAQLEGAAASVPCTVTDAPLLDAWSIVGGGGGRGVLVAFGVLVAVDVTVGVGDAVAVDVTRTSTARSTFSISR